MITLTADAFEESVRASRDAGMNGHIAKPIDPETLYKTLAAAFRSSHKGSTEE